MAGAEKIWLEKFDNQAQLFLNLTFKGNKNELVEIWKNASENLKTTFLSFLRWICKKIFRIET